MSIYANGLRIHTNEIAFLEFREQNQVQDAPVCMIAVQYEFLKQMHIAIGEALMQHETRLSEVSKAKSAMN